MAPINRNAMKNERARGEGDRAKQGITP